ncbi:GLEYA domain-containing protein [Hirsutella rhossiliensis]|uniref:GLEYA domain-containing protein n=1 Tax=Hirsutella rhossiliensis TaxID=111463 RepID=A0A9P8MS72_9HYPO|nr:GLEYA domain-containing protein [Hirsutella rhossiliensis]KAH0960240.1 GLEYA domain-containing protein [Hirsutella rhossiliensis]
MTTTTPGGVPYNDGNPNCGTTKKFGIVKSDSTCTNPSIIYDKNVPSLENIVLQHIAYFHPSKKGTYTFNVLEADDAAYIWFGKFAKDGFNSHNADITKFYGQPQRTPLTYQVEKAGAYIPFRLLYVNAQTCAAFSMTVKDPDGNEVVLTEKNKQFVFGCSKDSKAPPFDF